MVDASSRTEQPTQRRRREARRLGHVARSSELVRSGQLLVVAVLISTAGVSLVSSLATQMSHHLNQAHRTEPSIGAITLLFRDCFEWAVSNVLPWSMALLVAAVSLNLIQMGFLLRFGRVAPDISRMSPVRGLGRLFSVTSGARFGFSLTKMTVLLGTAGWFLWSKLPLLVNLSRAPLGGGFLAVVDAVAALGVLLASILIAIGIGDYFVQRWQFERSLRMTPEEIRREARETEGDPQLRRQRRQVHRERAAQDSVSEPAAEPVRML